MFVVCHLTLWGPTYFAVRTYTTALPGLGMASSRGTDFPLIRSWELFSGCQALCISPCWVLDVFIFLNILASFVCSVVRRLETVWVSPALFWGTVRWDGSNDRSEDNFSHNQGHLTNARNLWFFQSGCWERSCSKAEIVEVGRKWTPKFIVPTRSPP